MRRRGHFPKLIGFFIVLGVAAVYSRVSKRVAPAPDVRRQVAAENTSDAKFSPPTEASPTEAPRVARGPVLPLAKADLNPLDVLAQKRAHARPAPPTSLARYSHLGLGRVTEVNERPYRVLGARAVPAEAYSNALGPVVFEENGLRVFEDRTPGWGDLRVLDGSQPLMVNPANGRLVVVTGTLKVSLADADQAARLAAEENLRLIKYDPTIKLAFLKAPPGYALLPALRRIGQRSGVSLVELEAVEGRAVPR